MRHKIRILGIIIVLLLTKIQAQQDPQYTQYMYNMSVLNPAYTTDTPSILNFGMLYRSQWQNAVGAPKTLTFFAHTPLSEKIEVGLSVVSDDIGDGALKENNIYADFAYILKLDDESNIGRYYCVYFDQDRYWGLLTKVYNTLKNLIFISL